MNKYLSRLTGSPRGEFFNPLTYPFLIATFFYGAGLLLLGSTSGVKDSSLHAAMLALGGAIPTLWGVVALATIVLGIVFLLTRIPSLARASGLLGFMVWIFAAGCWIVTGGWLLVFTVALPNTYFWVWQYFSLSKFQAQDKDDRESFNHGSTST